MAKECISETTHIDKTTKLQPRGKQKPVNNNNIKDDINGTIEILVKGRLGSRMGLMHKDSCCPARI